MHSPLLSGLCYRRLGASSTLFSRLTSFSHSSSSTQSSTTPEGDQEERVRPGQGDQRQACWRIRSYGGLDALRLEDDLAMPTIRTPDEVLVRVKAASINPLDVVMTEGYGYPVLGVLRDLRRYSTLDFGDGIGGGGLGRR